MRGLVLVLAASMASLAATIQPPSPAVPTPQTAPAPKGPAAQAPARPPGAPSETYTYQPDGRRDPFVNLLGTGAESRLGAKRGEGASGLMTAELTVRGVMQSRGGLVALIQGPDKKTYLVHAGDKLMDGMVKAITQEGLVVVQSLKDPLSLDKTREVRKVLRSVEDTRQ
jgi:Tfp pilus assembly protein PilP